MVDVIESKEEMIDYLKSIEMYMKDNPDVGDEESYRMIRQLISYLS